MGTHRSTEPLASPAAVLSGRGIFDSYHDRVFRFFKSRGFQDDEADDLTQETFFRVWQKIETLRSQAALESWILRIAANVWKNEIRYRKTGKRYAEEVALGDPQVDSDALDHAALAMRDELSPLEKTLLAERLAATEKCVEVLPSKMRRCLMLYVFQQRKYQEVADLLKLSIQTVKSHIHQARQRLTDCVGRRLAGGAS